MVVALEEDAAAAAAAAAAATEVEEFEEVVRESERKRLRRMVEGRWEWREKFVGMGCCELRFLLFFLGGEGFGVFSFTGDLPVHTYIPHIT